MPIRILHTSDWHLGRTLADVDRTADFASFLDWLVGILVERKPDVLLVAGDVFDTTMPSTAAQRLYYDFLRKASETSVKAVIITAGNHDSARFLGAARPLLKGCRVFVAGDDPEEQAFVVEDESGMPILGVAAVPYLREGDVRTSALDLSNLERAELWERGVFEHYQAVRHLLLDETGGRVPLVAMGHLFVTGSSLSPGVATPADYDPSVYVGSLKNVTSAAFGTGWHYVALGHIHHAQSVKAEVPVRYCGAPLALHFGHAAYDHQVVLVTIDDEGRLLEPEILPVPQPREIVSIKGTLDELKTAIADRANPGGLAAIVEAEYEGDAADASIVVDELQRAAEKAGVVLGAVRRRSPRRAASETSLPAMSLDDITPEDVFRSVAEREIEDAAEREKLTHLFNDVLHEVRVKALPDEEPVAVAGAEKPAEESTGKTAKTDKKETTGESED